MPEQEPVIRFTHNGTKYAVSTEAYDSSLIVLPDGTLIRVEQWIESHPPQPAKMTEVPSEYGTDPQRIAHLTGASVATKGTSSVTLHAIGEALIVWNAYLEQYRKFSEALQELRPLFEREISVPYASQIIPAASLADSYEGQGIVGFLHINVARGDMNQLVEDFSRCNIALPVWSRSGAHRGMYKGVRITVEPLDD